MTRCTFRDLSRRGYRERFDATLSLRLDGTGSLAGFSTIVEVPVRVETHSDPRNPVAPYQDFGTEMLRLEGRADDHPDFELLEIVGGSRYGFYSPGNTTLRERGDGTYDVRSVMLVGFRLLFRGAAGGPLAGVAGAEVDLVQLEASAIR